MNDIHLFIHKSLKSTCSVLVTMPDGVGSYLVIKEDDLCWGEALAL